MRFDLPKRGFCRAPVFLFLILAAFAPQSVAQRGQLSFKEVLNLLDAGDPPARVAGIVEKFGVSFAVDRESERRLRSVLKQNGASESEANSLIGALRKAAPKPSRSEAPPAPKPRRPVESEPAEPPEPVYDPCADLQKNREKEQKYESVSPADYESALYYQRRIVPCAEKTDPDGGVEARRKVGELQEKIVFAANTRLHWFFVPIPAGEFDMGCSPDDNTCNTVENPRHHVQIIHGFEMGQYLVTQAMWESVMTPEKNLSHFRSPNNPVEYISWDEVQEFLAKLNAKADGYHYRLPSEAEWEYAARAGSTAARYGAADAIAWYEENSGLATHEVGQKAPNAWKLYDTLGNVWEWVQDWWDPNYYQQFQNTPAIDPKGPPFGQTHAVRGSPWDYKMNSVRVSFRNPGGGATGSPQYKNYDIGFRCARDSVSGSSATPAAVAVPGVATTALPASSAAISSASPASPAPSAAPQSAVPTSATWTDSATGLTWTGKDNGSDIDWNVAGLYCQNLRIDNFSGWRLPTIDELRAIYAPNSTAASGEGPTAYSYHVKGDILLTGETWSATQNDSREALVFSFASGLRDSEVVSRSAGRRALCVR